MNLIPYQGCVVRDERIAHVCLEKYAFSLVEYASHGLSEARKWKLFKSAQKGIRHLISIALAHSDITLVDVCIDDDGRLIVVDFDGCLPFGERLMKGIWTGFRFYSTALLSSNEDGLAFGLDAIDDFLWD